MSTAASAPFDALKTDLACGLLPVKWQCCNCARDIRFGQTTLTDAQYEKTACFQCRNRPKEVIARMRTENYVAPIPRHLDPQYQVSNRGVAFTAVCGLILIAIAVGSYAVGSPVFPACVPLLQPLPTISMLVRPLI